MLNHKITTVGIDIGGTKIAAAPLVGHELDDSVLIKKDTPQNNPELVLQMMLDMVQELKAKFEIEAVGVSTAGVVDDYGTMLGSCGNIQGWKSTPVKSSLEASLGLPVIVENDANCAAFAEYKLGAAKASEPLLLVIVGTGIGGGLVYKNQIWRGANFAGVEIGHMKITDDKQAFLCTCGALGCWEAYASGTGLKNIARKIFADEKIDSHQVLDLYQRGDAKAVEVFESWHYYLALGMNSIIHCFDPQAIVVSGGMAKFIDYKKLNQDTDMQMIDAIKGKVNISEGKLGNHSGIIGAALLAQGLVA